MTWVDFYFACFIAGFGLSVLALVGGRHAPARAASPFAPRAAGAARRRRGTPVFNFATLAAFLVWFGGVGYLLSRYYAVWYVVALGVAVLSGLGAASIAFWFLAKVLMAQEAPLDPADYDMVGVLGRLSISIRPGGTGELIYSQEGTRRVAGARSEDGAAIPRGTEVIVTRYEKGIAYVRPWVDPADEFE